LRLYHAIVTNLKIVGSLFFCYSESVKEVNFPYGKAIKILRSEAELTRKELAEKSGVSYSYLAEIESGKKKPSSDILSRIARGLGVRPSTFFSILEEMAEGVPITPLQIAESKSAYFTPPAFPSNPSALSKRRRKLLEEICSELNDLDEKTLEILAQLIKKLKTRS
jgi:transcriptional regulator with XRE-family HTH domain